METDVSSIMNKKKSIEEIISIYNEFAVVKRNVFDGDDYRKLNRYEKKLVKIFKTFEEDEEYGHSCIDALFKSDNIIIRNKMSTYCLALNYRVDEAEEMLRSIRDCKDAGMSSLEAKWSLETWKKDGKFIIYRK